MGKRTRTTTTKKFTELDALTASVVENYGTTAMHKGTDSSGFLCIETGCFVLDFALLGGAPDGLATMIYGWEGMGKTTLTYRLIAAAQRKYPDKAVVLVDAEQTYAQIWAESHGVDSSRLYVIQPDSAEAAIDIAYAAILKDETAMLVVDSVSALVPTKLAEKSSEDSTVALHARLVQVLTQKVYTAWMDGRPRGHTPSVIYVNQFRSKIALMGDTRELTGGKAIRFQSSAMIEMKNKEITGPNRFGVDIVTHNEHSFVIKKNKAGNSMRQGAMTMIRDPDHVLGAGAWDDARAMQTIAKKMGFYTGAGKAQKFALTGERMFARQDDFWAMLNTDLEMRRRTAQLLICAQRVHQKLPTVPSDGWLYGEVDDEVRTLAETVRD